MRGRRLFAISMHSGGPNTKGLWLYFEPSKQLAIFERHREARAEASRLEEQSSRLWREGLSKQRITFSVVPIWAEPTGEQAWTAFPMIPRGKDKDRMYAKQWFEDREANAGKPASLKERQA